MKKIALAICLATSLMAVEPSAAMVEAVKKGDVSSLEKMISSKDDTNAALANGKTILMLAAWEGKIEAVNYLIGKGADINAKDASGKTALMLAVWRENIALIKLLIEKGADKNAKNSEGLGILEIAELTGSGELIDYLNKP